MPKSERPGHDGPRKAEAGGDPDGATSYVEAMKSGKAGTKEPDNAAANARQAGTSKLKSKRDVSYRDEMGGD